MKNRLKELGFVAWFLILLLLGSAILGVGSLAYKATFGVASKNIDRQIYEQSASHVKGVARDLTDYRYQLDKTEDKIEREAIIRLINSRFADFDVDQLNDRDLAQFLRDARNGKLN